MCCLNFKSEINSLEHWDDKETHLEVGLFLLNLNTDGQGPPPHWQGDAERMFCLLMGNRDSSSEGKQTPAWGERRVCLSLP